MKKYFIIFVLMLVQGCGGGGSSSVTPTDPNTVFQTFPAGLFNVGYSVTTNYTGSDTAGGVYTATFSSQTQAQATFLGVDAIPVLSLLELTNTANGAFVSIRATAYWTTLADDRHYLGIDIPLATTTVSATTTAIPQTVKIGDFGVIGTYTDNASNVDEQSWRVDDGFNGRAKLVELSTETDQFGNFVSSSTSTSLIDTNGNDISETLVIFDAETGITITINSN